MKKRTVALCLAGALALGTCTVSAANGTKDISATFRNIKIVVDGKELSTSAEPFIYNGTTYLPIRAVGEAVGKEVTWDGDTNTVYLGEAPVGGQQPPAETEGHSYLVPNDMDTIIEFIRSDIVPSYVVADIYIYAMDNHMDDSQFVEAVYAEAQSVFELIVDSADYAMAKERFEKHYQENILPALH